MAFLAVELTEAAKEIIRSVPSLRPKNCYDRFWMNLSGKFKLRLMYAITITFHTVSMIWFIWAVCEYELESHEK